MDLPLGFDKRIGSKVCKLKNSLYGLKQSPWAWFKRLTHFMKKISFVKHKQITPLFLKYCPKDKVIVLTIYVDCILLTGEYMVEMNHLKKYLATEFEIKDLGALRYFLGRELT